MFTKIFLSTFFVMGSLMAREAAFKIGGKTTYVQDLQKEDEAAFYKIEKERYELIEQLAHEKYLEHYWKTQAKKSGKSVEAARKAYFDKNVKVSAKELKENLDRFKDHPQLKKLAKKEQEKQIKDYLKDRKRRELLDGIISGAKRKKDLVINYNRPKEPTYNVKVTSKDNVRYGPGDDDIKPMGCSNDCKITVVEYSEFQCPFCAKVLPTVKRLMTEYKGKVRWVVRDFPLNFHNRARPAAIAAHCAAPQKKYWAMYTALFNNQRQLEDADLKRYASKIKGLDMGKWEKCFKSPGKIDELITTNMASGSKVGVTGTPAFFINGRKLSGALPYSEFKRIFDEELASQRKTH